VRIPKKLIEVALPLDDINLAAAKEKSIRHGHPSTLHLWWARRPLAAARAVIFAQMVNDPGGERGWLPGKTKQQAITEREELFEIIRELVKWENTNNEKVLTRAREAIRKSWRETCELNPGEPDFDPEKLPAFHDPFAGGGAIPLEAQRLGLESHASDLNPVAVMINKAMIEIPPKFAGQKPVGPLPSGEQQHVSHHEWPGAKGLAEDVRRYGNWMREEAQIRIGHLYPKIQITPEMVSGRPDLKGYEGRELTVIAWLWAKTVKSPNPAFSNNDVPLISNFVLSSKKGKETYILPVIEGDTYRFEVMRGVPPDESKSGTKSAHGANFYCLLSKSPINGKYIKAEGMVGRMGSRLMAIVAEGKGERVYLSPNKEMETIANEVKPEWEPELVISGAAPHIGVKHYGIEKFKDLFTRRQLLALGTFSDLVQEARAIVIKDAKMEGMADDNLGINDGGSGATAYGDALAVYLAFAVDKSADYWSAICTWHSSKELIRNTFSRQVIPIVWDFVETNPFSNSTGKFLSGIGWAVKVLEKSQVEIKGSAFQKDAQSQSTSIGKVVSIDPPYYDNICYSDISDFFYVWMRRSLRNIYPDLFSTLAVPKEEEIVAFSYRHGSKKKAEAFFLNGMKRSISNLAGKVHPAFPITIYYAFKQSETSAKGTFNTGWETFLESIISSGFSITGTWPMRTELINRMRSNNSNTLASSIVLVCSRRPTQLKSIPRRDLLRELREEMPLALKTMIGGKEGTNPIAPVDLAQAAIGPGMAIFSKYERVLNQDGSKMEVHDAMILINREITEYLNPDSGNFDSDTLFCSDWFAQNGWKDGNFGDAETLTRAKGTSVEGISQTGVLESGRGKVRLLKWKEYRENWIPQAGNLTPVWEACHQLIRVFNQKGETDTGVLLAQMPERGEAIRQLAYHLYTLCERKGWAEDASVYNDLVVSWYAIVRASKDAGPRNAQFEMNLEEN